MIPTYLCYKKPPKPKTQNPKPKTQNPKPKTQNPLLIIKAPILDCLRSLFLPPSASGSHGLELPSMLGEVLCRVVLGLGFRVSDG